MLTLSVYAAGVELNEHHPDSYTVRKGDTLWSIATAHYAGDPREGVWEIEQTNRLPGATIQPGQRLVLPTG